MRFTTYIATAVLLLAAFPGVHAHDPADDEDVYVYTNADIEKLEPIPTGRPPVYTTFDTEAWAFVSAFIAREREKITSDRDHELERERVEIEADRPVGYGERYPFYLRVPYDQDRPRPRVHDDGNSGVDVTSATRNPHPMFRERPPVREFTPGLGNSYRNHGHRPQKGPK
jgi:hypothetical protein